MDGVSDALAHCVRCASRYIIDLAVNCIRYYGVVLLLAGTGPVPSNTWHASDTLKGTSFGAQIMMYFTVPQCALRFVRIIRAYTCVHTSMCILAWESHGTIRVEDL